MIQKEKEIQIKDRMVRLKFCLLRQRKGMQLDKLAV